VKDLIDWSVMAIKKVKANSASNSKWPSTRDASGPMKRSIGILNKQKIQSQDADGLPESAKRFADGSRYKIEIPSVEGPAAFKTVLDEAKNPYGDGGASRKIYDTIKKINFSTLARKKFHDL
jgi:hypothetical protein